MISPVAPASASIDGKAYPIEPGESILQFVERLEGQGTVPTLCYDSRLKPFGSCRVCSVEVQAKEGAAPRVVAACHTPVTDGMIIYHRTDRVDRVRRNILELMLSDMSEVSPDADNEFNQVARKLGVEKSRYSSDRSHKDVGPDTSHPYMVSDLSQCINCYRCVRACDEIQGEFVLGMHGRGFTNRIIKGMDQSFKESPCVSCGACSQTCPTGAINDVFNNHNIKPEKVVRTVCSYCGVGCNLDVAVRDGKILGIKAPVDAEVNAGHTCLKGRYAFNFYKHPDRLRSPMIKRNGAFEEVSWDEAYDYIVAALTRIRSENGPDAIAGISSARCTNEENYLMQKFIRAVIGTNNIDCCARVCHSPTAYGMQQSFGTGAATNSIEDIQHTDLIMVIGANPTQAHPVTGAKIKQFALKNKPVIVVDPIVTEMARHARYHLQLRPGSNVALLNMFTYYILKEGLVDQDFIDRRCEGFDEFRDAILALDLDIIEERTGVPREKVREAAIAYGSAPNAMTFHGLGVTEHSQGSKTVMLMANLNMMTGNIGRIGVGMNPLRGQNNVQGAADMGVQPHQGAGYMSVTDPEAQHKYTVHYGVEAPKEIGLKIPQMFNAAITGRLKALWIMGEDVVQTDPNTHHVVKSLEALDLLVVQDIFLSETAKMADVVLPASSFVEKNGTFTNGERRVQRVNRVVEPLHGTRPDGVIMVDIMNRMGMDQAPYDAAGVLEEVAEIVPFFKGITWDRLGKDGLQWPVAEDGTDTAILHTETFKRGRGRFHHFEFEESSELLSNSKEFPLVLTTGRELEHYNCGTMTRRTPNNEILTEDTLLVHPEDAAARGITNGDSVRLFSKRGEAILNARLTEDVNPGVLYTTFHFPEMLVNMITSEVVDAESMCPEYKVTAVELARA